MSLSIAEQHALAEGLAVALQDQMGYDVSFSEKVAGFLASDRDVWFAIERIIKARG